MVLMTTRIYCMEQPSPQQEPTEKKDAASPLSNLATYYLTQLTTPIADNTPFTPLKNYPKKKVYQVVSQDAFYMSKCSECELKVTRDRKKLVAEYMKEHIKQCKSEKTWYIKKPTVAFEVAQTCPLFNQLNDNSEKCTYFKSRTILFKTFLKVPDQLIKHLKKDHSTAITQNPDILSRENVCTNITYKEVPNIDCKEVESEEEEDVTILSTLTI